MKKFLNLIVVSAWFGLPLFGESAGPENDGNFSSSVSTSAKPWTKRDFKNDPKDFQFAIVSDRTGGMRRGVFSRAVRKVNELQPEFVITVGDLIAGGGWQKDEKEIRRQWDEFNGFVDRFEMPFFYLPGNHDVSNALMDRIWDEKYGVRYYSFVYKDVLFLCLNTQDGDGSSPFLGKEQVSWVKDELKEFPDVRWTMVFIHQPLWVFEEGIMRNVKGKRVLRKSKTGWPEVEAALSGRKHTVYAGHVHRYAKYERNEANYYTLGTTGGGSALRGNPFGEFDHASWITMTDDGPRMMNLTLDGMLPEDVTTEADQKFWRNLKFTENIRETFPFQKKALTLPLANPLDKTMSCKFSWILPVTDHWTVSPRRVSIELAPGEKREITFEVNHEGDVSTYFPIPRMLSHFHSVEEPFHLERAIALPLDLTEHVKKYPSRARISSTEDLIRIDGKLEEAVWMGNPTIARLIPRQADGYPPVRTEAWITHDETNLYLGFRCHESLLRDVLSEVSTRDREVKEDDSIELLIDASNDKKSFHHFVINPDGVLFDARRDDAKWNSTAEIATSFEDQAWTVEISVPLREIEADLSVNREWGVQVIRNRPRLSESKSYQWSPTFWYGNYLPSLFGRMTVE